MVEEGDWKARIVSGSWSPTCRAAFLYSALVWVPLALIVCIPHSCDAAHDILTCLKQPTDGLNMETLTLTETIYTDVSAGIQFALSALWLSTDHLILAQPPRFLIGIKRYSTAQKIGLRYGD